MQTRPYRHPDDLGALYRICLETGNEVDHDHPKLHGHAFAAPYATLEPSLAFVASDDKGVGGYVLGALDTKAFADLLEREWWSDLREQYPLTIPSRVVRYIHEPPRIDIPDHPSHLHVNLLPRLKGLGAGGALVRTVLDAMRAQGSHGVHLHVRQNNEHAIGFYRHLGFTEIDRTDEKIVFGMRF